MPTRTPRAPRPDPVRRRGGVTTERTTSADGTTIAFDRSGKGPAVVLVGGALGDRSAAAPLAAHLAPTFTVIAFDRRGRGDSEDAPTYSVQREVEDIEALIGEVGGSAFLFGHSSGAVLSLEAASALGDRVPKLALYEPPCIVDDSRPAVPPDLVERLSGLIADGRRGDAVASFLTEGPGMPAEVVEAMRGEQAWASFEALAHTLAYDLMIMTGLLGGDPAALERWASLDAPTLLMDGDASPLWQRNTVGTLAAVLPHARRRSLAGQDHGPADELLASVLAAYYTR